MSDSKRRSYIVRDVAEQLDVWEQLRPAIEQAVDGDIAALIDTLDGETNLTDALSVIVEESENLKMQIAGIKTRLADLGVRKSRLEKSNSTLRGIVEQAMDRAGLPTIKSPLFTVSLRRTAPGLDVADEMKIPAAYWKQPDPVLDRKALKAALDDGTQVAGAHLDNGGISLTVRVK